MADFDEIDWEGLRVKGVPGETPHTREELARRGAPPRLPHDPGSSKQRSRLPALKCRHEIGGRHVSERVQTSGAVLILGEECGTREERVAF